MNKWQYTCLTEVTSKIGDGLHGTPQYDDDGEYYFINGNNLANGKIHLKPDTKKVSKDEFIKHAKPITNKTILLSINGTIGNLALYNGEKCMLGKSACFINVNEKADRDFMYYLFCSNDFQHFITENATGTTIPNVPLKGIREYYFNLPPLPEQKAIAEVLSSLDNKIDLLHRQNKTLEQMAETLFRKWFIEDASENWEEGILGDLVNVKYGKDHKKLDDGMIPVYGSGGIMRCADTALYEKESVLIPRKGTLNNVFYINEPFWTVDTMFYTEMKQPNLAKFVYHFVRGHDLANMNVGSAVPSMTTQVLNNMPVLIPSDKILTNFERVVSPMYLKMEFNQKQIHILEKLRDGLLPKLMKGDLNITI